MKSLWTFRRLSVKARRTKKKFFLEGGNKETLLSCSKMCSNTSPTAPRKIENIPNKLVDLAKEISWQKARSDN